jgi:hypothetical protein
MVAYRATYAVHFEDIGRFAMNSNEVDDGS